MQLVRSRVRQLIRYGLLTLLTLTLSMVVACGQSQQSDLPANSTEGGTESSVSSDVGAIAQVNLVGTALAPTISGQISLEETPAGLNMQGQFANIPIGMHGFHIHEGGSCEEGGGAAGGHFNPRDVGHGHLPSQGFDQAHAGDLGNLQSTSTEQTDWNLEVPGLTLTSGEYAVADRTFILHADPDDLSQPTGNAGARIACGIIQMQ